METKWNFFISSSKKISSNNHFSGASDFWKIAIFPLLHRRIKGFAHIQRLLHDYSHSRLHLKLPRTPSTIDEWLRRKTCSVLPWRIRICDTDSSPISHWIQALGYHSFINQVNYLDFVCLTCFRKLPCGSTYFHFTFIFDANWLKYWKVISSLLWKSSKTTLRPYTYYPCLGQAFFILAYQMWSLYMCSTLIILSRPTVVVVFCFISQRSRPCSNRQRAGNKPSSSAVLLRSFSSSSLLLHFSMPGVCSNFVWPHCAAGLSCTEPPFTFHLLYLFQLTYPTRVIIIGIHKVARELFPYHPDM